MQSDLNQRISRIDALLGERLYLRGSLREKLADAKGRLPATALKQARELVQARDMLANPNLATKLDRTRIAATCDMLERHLDAVPEGKYRRRAWSAMFGTMALRVLIVIALFLAIIWWRGLV